MYEAPRPRMLVMSVCVFGTVSSETWDGRRDQAGAAVSISSLRYAGVADDVTLNASEAILYVIRSLMEASETTWVVVWRQLDCRAGRRLWPGCSVPALRCHSRCTVNYGVAVVQSGGDDAAWHRLNQVVDQQTAHVMCCMCYVML